MVKITVKISDPLFSREIEIDYTNCKTEDSLKKLIADAFLLESSQITIENLPQSKIIDPKVTEYSITIKNNSKNIKFKLPNLTTLTIMDGYKMKYNGIIQEFKSKKTYISLSAENNLLINFSNKYNKGFDLKKILYPFLGVPKNSTVDVVTTDSFVILEFNEIKFYLLDTDTIRIAQDLIFDAFRKEASYDSIKITKDGTEDPLPGSYKLKKRDKYNVHVGITFEFKNLSNSKFNLIRVMDYFTTVSDAQKYLFTKFQNQGFKFEDFHIMTNQNDNEIADDIQYLREFEDKHKNVYYEIAGLPRPKQAQEKTDEKSGQIEENPKKPKIKNKNKFKPSIKPTQSAKESKEKSDSDNDDDDELNESTEIRLVFEDSTNYSPIKMDVNVEVKINDIKRVVSRKYKVKEDEIEIFYIFDKKEQPIKEDNILQNKISAILDPPEDTKYDYTFYIKINHIKSQRPLSSSRPIESKKPSKYQRASSKDDADQKEQQKNKKKPSKVQKTSSEKDDQKEQQKGNKNPSKKQRNGDEDDSTTAKNFYRFVDSRMFDEFLKNKKMMGSGATSIVYKVKNLFEGKGLLALKMLKREIFNLENKESKSSIKGDWEDDDDFEVEEDEEEKNEIPFKIVADFFKEFEILLFLQHPNIIKTYGFYQGDRKHPPSLLLEYCKYNLQSAINKLNNIELIKIVYEICSAMEYLHKNNVIHRDLKITNILINTQKEAKICDFGISKIVDDTMTSMTHEIGTLIYMAPELFNKNSQYNNKVDVYSFGVVLYFITTKGSIPVFNQKVPLEDLEIPKSVNKLSRDLIKKCWSFSSKLRPSFTEIIKIIVDNNFRLFDEIEEKDIDSLRLSLNIEK